MEECGMNEKRIAELLRKQEDPEKRTDILDRIDRGAITRKLMEMLKIRNREDQTIGITKVHVEEIKEYLKALDLVDLPKVVYKKL